MDLISKAHQKVLTEVSASLTVFGVVGVVGAIAQLSKLRVACTVQLPICDPPASPLQGSQGLQGHTEHLAELCQALWQTTVTGMGPLQRG